ncbi:Pre-mRNA-splicing factor cwc2 [Trichoplax sp. H2]|uniref:Uncharacterized protein n=1 Tax=Trichoplax adhaerens TaxID=10228 RepID=B3RVJ1_TRIAD|nr:hypothetical protein TRIADDRAFT_55671 [Trichoplax adhaerens]EDV25509.1 hypothetical protein TRIADDRAFT_55671 [Trichoplax adhaerens]RDD46971.1 Pre-mRNA-splicing factor cwc2 [Trichoplax sp. H2]|eukprot:XP_002111542.1 hypothetical protein TRIADDRAFT_55671 [Trichoplax adhaerens]
MADNNQDQEKIQVDTTIPSQDSIDNHSYDQSEYWNYYAQYYSQYYQQRGDWMAIYDQNNQKYYYHNTSTKATQWDKPAEWDSTTETNPITDGNNTNITTDHAVINPKQRSVDDLVKIWLKRPARKQVEEQQKVHWRPEGAQEYNIWYDRWVGELWKGEKHGGPATTRCVLKRDAGYTKANLMDNRESRHYWCIYFARGCCHLGSECTYYHTIPLENDNRKIDLAHDVFGRERFRSHRDDMGGIGSFDKETRTLYVGGLHHRDNQESILEEEFGEWGEIEDVRYIPKLHVAFVRYRYRLTAEFAKAAMADQKFNDQEVLNVRWAHDDPNPKARVRVAQERQDKFLTASRERDLTSDGEPSVKRLRSDDIIGYYPNTDAQYIKQQAEPGPKTKEEIEQENLLSRVQENYSRLDRIFQKIQNHQVSSSDSGNSLAQTADPYRRK